MSCTFQLFLCTFILAIDNHVNQGTGNASVGVRSQPLQNKHPNYDTSDYAESSLVEEVHEVQEDRARSFLQDFIKTKNSQDQQLKSRSTAEKIQSHKNTPREHTTLNPALQINSHFEELKSRQKDEQKRFHQKLMQELSTTTSRTKPASSFVSAGTASNI